MSGNNEEQDDYKASSNQPSDSSKEATKTVAKGAANAYLGPVGGKAVDALSKTKLGDAILTKGAQSLEKQPFGKQMAKMADKSGALNAANQAMDAKSGGSGQAPLSSGSAPSSSMNLDRERNISKSNALNTSKSDNTDVATDATTRMIDFASKYKFKILGTLISFFLIMFIVLIIGGAVVSFADGTVEFFRDAWDSIKKFVTGDKTTQEWEYEYYQKLDEVQETLSSKYGVCIDINLITATLTVDMASDHYIQDGKDPETETADGSELGLTGADYKKMIKHIELLGNMQIRRTVYGLDERVKAANAGTGIANDYCKKESEEYVVQDDSESSYFKYSDGFTTNLLNRLKAFGSGQTVRNSTDVRLIASNDIQPGIWNFLTKKANEERNIEYKFYVPAYTYPEKKDADGNTYIDYNDPRCYSNVPNDIHDFAKLDIGSLNDMENNVYYWNLMDSFIADYYSDYLPNVSGPLEVGSEKYEKIKKIISDIYLLYNEMGPNQCCEASSYICRDDEGSDYYGGGDSSLTRSEFIDKIAPIAIEEMERTGIFASITIAQAAIESGNGASKLSSKYSNYYGMTAGDCGPKTDPSGFVGVVYASGEGDNTCQGNAFWNGSVVSMCNSAGKDCQWYRVYDSFKNSNRDHSRLISESYGCNQSTY